MKGSNREFVLKKDGVEIAKLKPFKWDKDTTDEFFDVDELMASQKEEIHRLGRIIKRETILSYIAFSLSISAFIAGVYLMVDK